MRTKKTFKNTVWAFAYEAVQIICSFILPRLILTAFGSAYNGVTGAITQFLNVISLFQAGIGGVTIAALYKPLAEKDVHQISVIVKSTESFLRKVVMVFLGFSVVLACLYPFSVLDQFDWLFTASLVMIMTASTFAQYFFGQTYQFLLNADQNQRLISMVNIAKLVISTLISVGMIRMGFGIRAVKLGSALVFVAAPIFVSQYTKKKYGLIRNVKENNKVLKQRWDNFGQQVANFVTANTDLMILSVFSNVYEVSVYVVYAMILNGVFGLFTPLTSGVGAAFGNMLAKGEHAKVEKNLSIYEEVVFAAATFLFSVTLVMAMPFIALYTENVSDVNYLRPGFLFVMVGAYMFRAFRVPYQGITNAAGHFRQTRNPAFAEAAMNVLLSILLVFKLGLVGVAAATLLAYAFRTVRYAAYLSKHIVARRMGIFVKRILLSFSCVLLSYGVSSLLPFREAENYYIWACHAVMVAGVVLVFVAAVEWLFYRKDLKELLRMTKGALRKK